MQVTLYSGTSGLNNKVDPVRLKFDPDTGVSELAEAINVEIDPSGRISRQRGNTILTTGEFKSLFGFGDYAVGKMKDAQSWSLVAIQEDGTVTVLRTGLTGSEVDYQVASDGEKDIVYYVDGSVCGKIYDMENHPWKNEHEYIRSTRVFSDPPAGHLITLFNGRMYVADGNVIYASMPLDFNRFDLGEDHFIFNSEITMIDHVDDGLWVSDKKWTYFLPGADTQGESFGFVKKSDKSIIRGTNTKIESEYIGLQTGVVILAWSDYGLHILGPGGFFTTPTKDMLVRRQNINETNYLPDSSKGATIIINDEQLITTLF